MKLKVDYNNMMKSSIGSKGIDDGFFADSAKAIDDAREKVNSSRGKGWQEWCESPYISKSELDDILSYGEQVRSKADSYVVLGIGGSALGAIAVNNALLHLRHNELPSDKRKAPKIYVEDNVDPERMNAVRRNRYENRLFQRHY